MGSSIRLILFSAISPGYLPVLTRTAVAWPLFAVLIFALAARPGSLLASRPMGLLGEASYSVYILQSPAMAYFLFFRRGIDAAGHRAPLSWIEFGIYSAVLIAISLACHRWIEMSA